MASLAVLKPSWTHPGAILGRLARILGRLEAVLERPGAVLDLPRTSQNGLKIDRKSDRKSNPSWGTLGSEKPLKTNKKQGFINLVLTREREARSVKPCASHLGTKFDTMRLAVTRGIVFGSRFHGKSLGFSLVPRWKSKESSTSLYTEIAPLASLASLAR